MKGSVQSKTKYRQVPKWAVQENCTFYFIVRVEIFIIQRFKVIKPKSARSFLKTLQWLPHRIVNITESFRLKGLLTVFLNSGWIKNTQPPPPQSTDGQPSFHSDSHVVAGERTTIGPAPPVFCSRHTGPPRASRTCQALPTPQGFCLKYFSPSDLSSIFLCLLQVFPHVTFSVIVRLLLVALYKNCSLSSPFPGLYIYFPSFHFSLLSVQFPQQTSGLGVVPVVTTYILQTSRLCSLLFLCYCPVLPELGVSLRMIDNYETETGLNNKCAISLT